jgi:HAD superfamily hydrolase (TIGR01509 family)
MKQPREGGTQNCVQRDKVSKMEVRALIFDLGNVIVKFDQQTMRSVFVTDGAEREYLPTAFNNNWPQVVEYECGRMTTDEFRKHVGEMIGRELSVEDFDAAWAPVFKLNAPVAELIPALKEKYPLVLLSNTNDTHWRWIRTAFAETLRHFDSVLLSYELKRMKPDREVFIQAAMAAGQPPEHCLFIDDIQVHVEGARAAGLQAVQYIGPETDALLRSLLAD